MNLQELTGYESGAVIFKDSKEGFITNWSSFNGIPRLFVTGFIGLNDGNDLKEVAEIDAWAYDLALELAQEDCDRVLEEGGILCNNELKVDKMYENDEVIIVTFEGWN